MYQVLRIKICSILVLAFLFAGTGCQSDANSSPAAPDFSLSDLSGQMISLKEHRGQVVLLDFWATWCPPCRLSIPELVALQEKYKDKGFVVIGVSLDDPAQFTDAYLQSFMEKNKINYKVLRFNKKVLVDYFAFESPAIPTMFIIDRKGRIRDKIVGFRPKVLKKSLAAVFS